jgi:hypothetical protein
MSWEPSIRLFIFNCSMAIGLSVLIYAVWNEENGRGNCALVLYALGAISIIGGLEFFIADNRQN